MLFKSKYSDYRKATGSMYTHLHDYKLGSIIDYRDRNLRHDYRNVPVYMTGYGIMDMKFPAGTTNISACVVANLRACLVFPFSIQAYDDGGIVRIVKRHGDKSVVASVFIPKKI